jgi:hypothetical protein
LAPSYQRALENLGQRALEAVSKSKPLSQAVKEVFSGLATEEHGGIPFDVEEARAWLGRALNYARNAYLKLGGDSFPVTHQADCEAGEYMTRAAVVRDHGARKGQYHADHVLGKDSTEVQEQLVGATAGGFQLRYARQAVANAITQQAQDAATWTQIASDPRATPHDKSQAKKEAREAAKRAAELRQWLKDSHTSFIGNKDFPDFPLKSEADYQRALQGPYVKGALERYRAVTDPPRWTATTPPPGGPACPAWRP